MGKRNLAIVGRHEDFFADIFDESTGLDPSIVVRCASPEDAATSYFKNLFENSNAHIRTAVIAVWPADGDREDRTLFDANAAVTPSREPDAEPGEVDVFLDVRLRA
jgi:hypothetical protein